MNQNERAADGIRHGARNHLPVPRADEILVVPLGGTSRVGMNATLVGHDGRWILVDVGATFAGADDDRGAELGDSHGGTLEQIVPDFRALSGAVNRIDAVVLTHAHEDHVGGLPTLGRFRSLWPRLAELPIHATRYTGGIVRNKLDEVGSKAKVIPMAFRKWSSIGPFRVAPLGVTHSAPETCALAIATRIGTIVLGSDLKLDPDPVLGRRTDTEALEALGASGVLAFLGDSTNACHAGRSASEGDVLTGLSRVMREHPGRVVVSTFASNLARVVSVAKAAMASGRILAASGRSILRNVETGIGAGILDPRACAFADDRSAARLSTSRSALVCTGTQAEPGSAMSKMADALVTGRRRPGFGLEAGDLVVHSARIIPGNEATVQAMFDTFRSYGVHVMEASGYGEVIHASGHAKRDELADYYRMLRPRFAVPVHGTPELTAAHLDLASGMGVQGSAAPREGEVLKISQSGLSIIGRLRIGQLATVAVGGRNSGETKLVSWSDASSPDVVEFDRPKGRSPRSRPQDAGRKGQGRRTQARQDRGPSGPAL